MRLQRIGRWIERNPAKLGLSISGILLLGLVVSEYALQRFTLMMHYPSLPELFRIAVVHCLMAGYFPAAYFALLRGTRDTVHELEDVLQPPRDASPADSAVDIGRNTLLIWGLLGVLIGVLMPFLTDDFPWRPTTWPPELWWHRLLGLFAAWWAGWLSAAVVHTSSRVSQLADRIGSVDLLDLNQWSPFVRQGLLTALLIVGGLSVSGLRLYEPQERLSVAILGGLSLPLAVTGLWLPVRGVNRRIREAKQAELQWTRQRIRESRTLLHSGSPEASPGQMADLTAYLKLVEGAPEWPFEGSTIVRMVLYLVMPAASWLGDLLLDGVLEQLIALGG